MSPPLPLSPSHIHGGILDAEKLAEAASKQATSRQNSTDHHRAGEAQRSSIGKCKVIAPYTATAKGQLTVKVNDMVDVQENSNSGKHIIPVLVINVFFFSVP